jgi:peptide/nickel transport system permease protein
MIRYALQRAVLAILVALTVSFVAFLLLNYATDPAAAIAGEGAEPEIVEQIRRQYGFERPLLVQYGGWLSGVFHGDLGESYYWRRPVGALILDHAPVTLRLAFAAICVTLLIAVPLGTAAALRPGSWMDRTALVAAVAAQAIPTFWLALVLVILLGVIVPVFPVSGDGTWLHYVLPAFVLGVHSVPAVTRLMRAGVLEVMATDYIRTARSKGYRGMRLLTRHAMRNAILPVISVLAVQLGHKLGGSVITESVFALNGLGQLALQSVLGGDIPTVETLVVVFALTFVALTFLADLVNAWLDPRLRLG